MSIPSANRSTADKPHWSDVGFAVFNLIFVPGTAVVLLLKWAGVF